MRGKAVVCVSILLVQLPVPFLFAEGASLSDPFEAGPHSLGAFALLESPGPPRTAPLLREATSKERAAGVDFVMSSQGLAAAFGASSVELAVPTHGPPGAQGDEPPAFGKAKARPAERRASPPTESLRLVFPGASAVSPEGEGPLSGLANILVGGPGAFERGLKSFAGVRYPEIYAGVDLRLRASSSGLKYEFEVHAGADWRSIALQFEGADSVEATAEGGLVVHAGLASLTDAPPVSFTDRGLAVDCRFAPRGRLTLGFACSAIDPGTAFTIDPLIAATYLGTGGSDIAYSFAFAADGSVIVAGETNSAVFTTTGGALDRTFNGTTDCFVSSFSSDLGSLQFSTFFGGVGDDGCYGVRVRGDGAIIVAGVTDSADFPATSGAFDTTANGSSDTFVAALGASGDSLLYATFVAGAGDDLVSWLELAPNGDPVVSGITLSTSFPTTPGAYDRSLWIGTPDGFVYRLAAGGDALVFSTLFGGSGFDIAGQLALDASENVHVAGTTFSANFPTTAGAVDRTFTSVTEGFVLKLNATGDRLLYSTFLGGDDIDYAVGVAIDPTGGAVVAGQTFSTDFWNTSGAWDTSHAGGLDAYVAALSSDGASLRYSTFLGAAGDDYATALAITPGGDAIVAGDTESPSFPVVPGSGNLSAPTGAYRGYLARVNSSGAFLAFSSFFGGTTDEVPWETALSANGTAFVAGASYSTDFETTPGAFSRTFGGGTSDAFVAAIRPVPDPVGVTIDSNRAGAQVSVGGLAVSTPYNFTCVFRAPVDVSVEDFQATADRRLTFAGWSDGGPQNHTALCALPSPLWVNFSAEFLAVVASDPPGLNIGIDGVAYPAPQSLWWTDGTTHDLDATVPQANLPNQRISFVRWSDGRVASHTVTVSGPVNLTATFETLVQVTVDTAPSGRPLAVDYIGYRSPLQFWWVAGSSHFVEARQTSTEGDARYSFYRWSDDFPRDHIVNFSAPADLTAYYTAEYLVRIGTDPPGLDIILDGRATGTPQALWWPEGEAHALGAPPRQETPRAVHTFFSWSTGATSDISVALTAPLNLNATFLTDFEAVLSANAPNVTLIVDGVEATAPATLWWRAGTAHTFTVPSPQVHGATRYTFSNWSDASAAEYVLTVDSPFSVVARVTTEHQVLVDSSPTGLELIVDAEPGTAPLLFWWPNASWHTLSAAGLVDGAATRYNFSRWSDAGTPDHIFTVSQPGEVVALYMVEHRVTFSLVPAALRVVVDGVELRAYTIYWWAEDSFHEVSVPSPQALPGTRGMEFREWSDGGERNRTLHVVGPLELRADFEEVAPPPPPAESPLLMYVLLIAAAGGAAAAAGLALRRRQGRMEIAPHNSPGSAAPAAGGPAPPPPLGTAPCPQCANALPVETPLCPYCGLGIEWG